LAFPIYKFTAKFHKTQETSKCQYVHASHLYPSQEKLEKKKKNSPKNHAPTMIFLGVKFHHFPTKKLGKKILV